MKKINIAMLCDQLDECADLENTETGEWWKVLANLLDYRGQMSDEFIKAVEKEIESTVKFIADNAEIVEHEEVETYTRKVKKLSWWGE